MVRARSKDRNPKIRPGHPKYKTSKERHGLNLIHLGSGREYEVRQLPPLNKNPKAVSVKKGNWLGYSKGPEAPKNIPFIDMRGKFTGSNLYISNLDSPSYLATVIATISRRMRNWVSVHNTFNKKSVFNGMRTMFSKCATYYALTKNSYFMDRFLFLSKNVVRNKGTILSILNRFVNKLDAHKGFIYGQACQHAYWLSSRVVRLRAKSSINFNGFFIRRNNPPNIGTFIQDSIYVAVSTVTQIGSIIHRFAR